MSVRHTFDIVQPGKNSQLSFDRHFYKMDSQGWSLAFFTHLVDADYKSDIYLPFFTPFSRLSIRRTSLLNGHLELVPVFIYSFSLTLYKIGISLLDGHQGLVSAFLYSLQLTLTTRQTSQSIRSTPRVAPCLSLLLLVDSL